MLPAPVLLPVQDILLPDTVSPRTLKEGVVEKKGHSVAFLMWPELVPLNIFICISKQMDLDLIAFST